MTNPSTPARDPAELPAAVWASPADAPFAAPRPAVRKGWRRHLDTLQVKLFLAIAGANVLLVMMAYLIYGWSFDQGLVEYLNRADEARLTPLIVRLAEGHREHGGWDWVAEDRQRWVDLLREAGLARGRRHPGDGEEPPPPPPGPGPFGGGPPGPPDSLPLTMDPRLMLIDPQGRVLIGPNERAAEAVRKPIDDGGRTVGYVAYVPRLQVVASLERWYAEQQNRKFGAIAIGLLAAVLLNAALIAAWLSRRLQPLRQGATALARGEYGTRIAAPGHDELAQLAGDFNRLAEALAAGQRMRQQWIADIAHELRTPLATLRAEIEALEDGVRPLTRDGMTSLGQEVARLSRLVEDLRTLSLSDLGALSYRREPLDLGELIDEALEAAGPALEARDLSMHCELAEGVIVEADGDRIAQVIGNLLQNTLRYTETPGRLQVGLEVRDGVARIVWQDSAPGVSPADLPRLTDRLFRLDDSRARASGGSGLGLAIVRAIVEAHGGRLQPGASPLGGLRWEIELPLAGSGGHLQPKDAA